MRLASFCRPDRTLGFGVVVDGGIRDVGLRSGDRWASASELARDIEQCPPDWLVGEADFAQSELELLSPSPFPKKIICVGLNYRSHIAETKRDMPIYPTLFPRYPDSVVGHLAPLVRPRESEQLDFEGELAVVIGRGGRRICETDALRHIAGFTVFNDGSVRDFQYKTTQFLPGKCFWRSGSAGPFLVTPDEAGPVEGMRLETRLNGEVVQSAMVEDLVFSIGRIISEISVIMPLHTGDIIATGTPGGVGVYRAPPLFMKPGDFVEVEISGVGLLQNPVISETE